MAQRSDLKGCDRLALRMLGLSGINTSVGTDLLSGIVQYWTAQSNIAAIFATVFATVGTTFLVEFDGYRTYAFAK